MLIRKSLKIKVFKILTCVLLAYYVVIGIGQHPVRQDVSPEWRFSDASFRRAIIPGQSNILEVIPEIVGQHTHKFNDYEIHASFRNEAMDSPPPNFHLEDFISIDDNKLFDDILEGCPVENQTDQYAKDELCNSTPEEAWRNFKRKITEKLQTIRKRSSIASEFIENNMCIYFDYTTTRDWEPYGGWIWQTRYSEARMFHVTFDFTGKVVAANFEDRKTKDPNVWTSFRVPD